MHFPSSVSPKCAEKDHVFLTVLNILTFCLNSQIGSRHSDLSMVFISETDDKGVWTLLQWAPVTTYYLLNQVSDFIPMNSQSSGIMHVCDPTELHKWKLRSQRHKYFCQDYYESKKRKKIPVKQNVGLSHICRSASQTGMDRIKSQGKVYAVVLCSHNTLPRAGRG